MGILNTCKTKVTDLEVTVFIDEDIRRFQISVDYTSRVNVFETPLINGIGLAKVIIQAFGYTHEYLVQEVLNELLLERSRRKEPMKIGSE